MIRDSFFSFRIKDIAIMKSDNVRCRKCRTILLSDDKMNVLDAHGEEHSEAGASTSGSKCTSLTEHTCLYLSEESCPEFVIEAVEESLWTKGKIYCPTCRARLGSFNFVSGNKCGCGDYVIPQVHILRSKVDWMKVGKVLPLPVSFLEHSDSLSTSSTLPLHDPERGEKPKGGGVDGARGTDDPDANESSTPSQGKLDRSQKKDRVDDFKTPECEVQCQRRSRKRVVVPCASGASNEGSSGGFTAQPSRFEVLEDEVTGAENDESSCEDEVERARVPDNLVCPVCLELLYSPLIAKPCGHVFCEPCLRRMARPNPTHTQCPMCRTVIGQCMPCPELAHDVKNSFFNLYMKRRRFELQHNTQHLPLPWTRDFRKMDAYENGGRERDKVGRWRSMLAILAFNFIGFILTLYLFSKFGNLEANLENDF